MLYRLLLLALITSCFACSAKLFQPGANSFRTFNKNNTLVLMVYNDQAALSEVNIIQSTAVSGFSQDIRKIEYKAGEGISVYLNDDYLQIFMVDNLSGLRDEGKTSLKFVDGIVQLTINHPDSKNNKAIEKMLRKTDWSTKNCDRNCKSGGCGSTQCEDSNTISSGISIGSKVSCRSGYFACCADNKIQLSYCIRTDCCK